MAHNTWDETKNHAKFKKTVTVDGATSLSTVVATDLTIAGGFLDATMAASTTLGVVNAGIVFASQTVGAIAASGSFMLNADTMVTGGLTASTEPVTLVDIAGGGGSCEVADGLMPGQTKTFVQTGTGDSLAITPANPSTGYATITLDQEGSGCSLLWTGGAWVITGRFSGEAAAAGAVDGLPVVA
jgi:hypothetical protein